MSPMINAFQNFQACWFTQTNLGWKIGTSSREPFLQSRMNKIFYFELRIILSVASTVALWITVLFMQDTPANVNTTTHISGFDTPNVWMVFAFF